MTSFFTRRTGLTLAALAALGLSSAAAQAQTFTSWTFNNAAVGTSLSPAATFGAGAASTLGMTNTYGTPGPSMDISDILVSPGTSTSPTGTPATDQGWRVRGGSVTGSSTAANGWSSLAPQYSQGAQFLTSTAGEANIKVTFDWNPTAQGVGDLELQYTTNGTTFQNAALFSAENGINGVKGSQFYNGLSYTFGTAAANDPNFGIRMVNAFTGTAELSASGTALNNSSGNWRFDNVNFSGTPNAPSVPEASTTVSLGLLLALGLGGLTIAKKRTARAS